MKYFTVVAFIGIFALIATGYASAAPVSWDFTSNVLRPLQSMWGSEVRVPYITATSTNATSTFPKLDVLTSFRMGSDGFSDLTGTGLQNTSGALTLNATGDWTGTIDGNNFAGGAIGSGDLLYGSGAGAISELGIGSTGHVLWVSGGLPAWVATTTLGTSASFTNSAQLAALLSDETGTGSFVLSSSPAFGGTATFSALTASSTLTLSGTAANIALGSNWLSGDGGDEGVFVDSDGDVGIGTSTPGSRFTAVGSSSGPIVSFFTSAIVKTLEILDTGVGYFMGSAFGVGTSTPAAKLAVQGTSGSAIPIFAVASSTNTAFLQVLPSGTTTISSGNSGTSTVYIYSSAASKGGTFILEDQDGAGCTGVTALNGVLTAATVTCPTEL